MIVGYLSSLAGFYNLAGLEVLPNQHPPMTIDLDSVNLQLRDASADTIVRWALEQGLSAMASTSFGRNAAVMLHLVSSVDKSVPTVWVDTGYNLRDTYIVAERLINDLQLNMHIYAPQMTSERRNAIMGGVPTIEDEELHQEFTRQVKLEPFAKAIADLQPEIWLTGIRREETEHRQGLDIVSRDARGILKVAPVFNWTEQDLDDYMEQHELPTGTTLIPPRCTMAASAACIPLLERVGV